MRKWLSVARFRVAAVRVVKTPSVKLWAGLAIVIAIQVLIGLLLGIAGCTADPATVRKLDDGDLAIAWNGYDVAVPKEGVDLQGFEVTPVPSDNDHWPPRGTMNFRDIPFEPVMLTVNQWVDGTTSDGQDIFGFDGRVGKRYEVYIYTRHAVRHEGDSILTWLDGSIVMHESRRMCHNDVRGLSVRDRDEIDGWCHYRGAGVPMFDLTTGEPFYFSVRGGTATGTYALLVVERYQPRRD